MKDGEDVTNTEPQGLKPGFDGKLAHPHKVGMGHPGQCWARQRRDQAIRAESSDRRAQNIRETNASFQESSECRSE